MENQAKMDELLAKVKFLAVCQTLDKTVAVETAKKLLSRNIRAMEIPYRLSAGDKDGSFDKIDECISAVRKAAPQMLVGAGTVTCVDTACRAIVAGSQFALSPGFDKKTAKFCIKNALPFYPGVATASEIMVALKLGLTTLKLFPCVALGGVALAKALSAPFPQVKFLISGGVTEKNAPDFLALKCVSVVSGSYLCADEKVTR